MQFEVERLVGGGRFQAFSRNDQNKPQSLRVRTLQKAIQRTVRGRFRQPMQIETRLRFELPAPEPV